MKMSPVQSQNNQCIMLCKTHQYHNKFPNQFFNPFSIVEWMDGYIGLQWLILYINSFKINEFITFVGLKRIQMFHEKLTIKFCPFSDLMLASFDCEEPTNAEKENYKLT